jgi:hypothetical protein
VWKFVSMGEERSEFDLDSPNTVRLQRSPGAMYDTEVEVWLDRHPPHWPVRALMRNGPGATAFELWRIDESTR